MHQIEIININPSDLATGGPFDFRIDRGPAELTSVEQADKAHPKAPTGPPALLDTDAGRIVIHGHRQIGAAAATGIESIPALVYPAGTSPQVVVALALEQCEVQGSGGPPAANGMRGETLTGIEKILAIYKTSVYGSGGASEPIALYKPVAPPHWIAPLYENLLGRRVSNTYLVKICGALAFPESELLALQRFRFSIDQIASLLVLSGGERAALLTLRNTVAFTTAETRQLVRLLVLARGRTLFDLDAWTASAAKNLTDGSEIVGSIEKDIHPALSERRGRIGKTLQDMRLPNRIRIKPPENLEGDSFSCYFRFSRLEELDSYVKLLGRVVQDGYAGQLLDLLNDDVADTEAQ